MARSLGLRVIAEGVETLRQMEVLHRLGCSLMQGFLFSRPIPPDDLEPWLQQTVLPRRAPWIGQANELDVGSARPRARRPAGRTEQGPKTMDMSHGASQVAATALSPVQVAKAALRRLALDKLEPTPENYARAYAAEGGHAHEGLPEAARPLLQRLAALAGRRRRQRRRRGAAR